MSFFASLIYGLIVRLGLSYIIKCKKEDIRCEQTIFAPSYNGPNLPFNPTNEYMTMYEEANTAYIDESGSI